MTGVLRLTVRARAPRRHASARMALTDVPPLAFTEVMRDVALFVGVTSVATDPAWRDSRG